MSVFTLVRSDRYSYEALRFEVSGDTVCVRYSELCHGNAESGPYTTGGSSTYSRAEARVEYREALAEGFVRA